MFAAGFIPCRCSWLKITHRKVIGTIAWYLKCSEEGYLRGMAVIPEWQGKGVAQQLLHDRGNRYPQPRVFARRLGHYRPA